MQFETSWSSVLCWSFSTSSFPCGFEINSFEHSLVNEEDFFDLIWTSNLPNPVHSNIPSFLPNSFQHSLIFVNLFQVPLFLHFCQYSPTRSFLTYFHFFSFSTQSIFINLFQLHRFPRRIYFLHLSNPLQYFIICTKLFKLNPFQVFLFFNLFETQSIKNSGNSFQYTSFPVRQWVHHRIFCGQFKIV